MLSQLPRLQARGRTFHRRRFSDALTSSQKLASNKLIKQSAWRGLVGRLAGKVAVITGTGGEGMGRAAALAFAREGAIVIGCDINVEGALETRARVRDEGGRMFSLQPLDMMIEDSAKALVAFAISEGGGIDILYNNVVSTRVGFAIAGEVDQFAATVAGNLNPTYMMIRHSYGAMAERGGGSVINIASIAGTGPGTGLAGNANFLFAYGVGKAGIVRMTQQLAIDLAPMGIRVNCLAPGSIAPVARKYGGADDTALNAELLRSIPLRRMGQPEDVARAAVFFASDESSYITGQTLTVDGGWTVSGGLGLPTPRIFELMAENGSPLPDIPAIYLERKPN